MKNLHGAIAATLLLTAIPAFAQTTTTTPPANTNQNQTDQTQTTVPVTPTDPSTSSTTTADPNATTTQNNQMATGDQLWYQGQNNEMRASQMIGMAVYNANNERIGEINEILLDNTGKVAAVIIGVGGFLGLGERDVAVAFNGIQMAREEDGDLRLTVNTTRETLTNAPAWTWPRT
jgi:sporulation protein YlmC with PRC-barrel domain